MSDHNDPMRCGILAIGNEILLGDVMNSNAHILSQRLGALGFQTDYHLTVADDFAAILGALDYLSSKVDLLFLTGGLGPTSDDFTRDVLAKWAKTEMVFHQQSWERIKEVFALRNYPVQEMQKQQCHFPKNADVLSNSAGTAPGFRMIAKGIEIFVLPGPPREVDAIWNEHLYDLLKARIPTHKRMEKVSWYCLGVGESQVAALAEPLLKNKGLLYGYRVCFPYVECRVQGTKESLERHSKLFSEISKQLSELSPVYPSADPLALLSKAIAKRPHKVYFSMPEGHLLLGQMLYNADIPAYREVENMAPSSHAQLVLGFHRSPGQNFRASFYLNGQKRVKELRLPRKLSQAGEERTAIEFAIWFWLQQLQKQSYLHKGVR